ncbi:MAG TPA: response regulator transcription factor [Candidatus Margulisiibacteriota bacterium]|nr:response regulator transcription factor [Candidatus Margulisiibacteriota bacterium]
MGKKILIVDDEANICLLVSAFLEKKGFTVITANNGKEGVSAAHKFLPDLILLDINMPKMDGFAVLEKLKHSPETMPIPVIMLSGRGDNESKIKASGSYSEYYITKPFELEELESKIKLVLRI